jgi:membrane associated rhomboid family serine protease
VTATLAIVLVTSAISVIGFASPALINALILWPPIVRQKNEYYRLATYGLVHGNFVHLLFNMIALYSFGYAIEELYDRDLGNLGFVFFYVVGLIVSILPTYLRNRDNADYRSLGASGAVSAVLFASVLLQPWSPILLYFAIKLPAIVFAVLYVAYSIYADRHAKDNINHSAHLWGAAYGVVFTLVMEPRLLPHFLSALGHPKF